MTQKESCIVCRIIDGNIPSKKIYEDEMIMAVLDINGSNPGHCFIFPKNHYPNIALLHNEELFSLAGVLKKLLSRLDELGFPPFNLKVHNADMKGENFHFHIEISPRLSIWAGFELETGTVINSVSPEDAAAFYRGE